MTERKLKNNKRKEWIPALKEIGGISIVSKYKYRGTVLDSKLTMETQSNFIRKKSNFLLVKLYPYLTNATADGRKDMWRTMVCPLFNSLLVLLGLEESDTQWGNFFGLWWSTFKKFMLIPQSTNTSIVEEMIGINAVELMTLIYQNSGRKWYARRNREEVKEKPELLKRKESKNYLKGIPNEWCTILKQQCGLCKICKNSTRNPSHMELKHGIEIPPYKEIFGSDQRVL